MYRPGRQRIIIVFCCHPSFWWESLNVRSDARGKLDLGLWVFEAHLPFDQIPDVGASLTCYRFFRYLSGLSTIGSERSCDRLMVRIRLLGFDYLFFVFYIAFREVNLISRELLEFLAPNLILNLKYAVTLSYVNHRGILDLLSPLGFLLLSPFSARALRLCIFIIIYCDHHLMLRGHVCWRIFYVLGFTRLGITNFLSWSRWDTSETGLRWFVRVVREACKRYLSVRDHIKLLLGLSKMAVIVCREMSFILLETAAQGWGGGEARAD
jgi:hypothetical protein